MSTATEVALVLLSIRKKIDGAGLILLKKKKTISVVTQILILVVKISKMSPKSLTEARQMFSMKGTLPYFSLPMFLM
jgi:hypothetical protein